RRDQISRMKATNVRATTAIREGNKISLKMYRSRVFMRISKQYSMQPVLVSFLWHMHQPFYKDLVRQSYVMPWAYLHGTKDYFGMPALIEEFPDVHQTFNLVPSLLLQLEEYADGSARDASLDLAFKPVSDLTEEERAGIIERFFPVPVRTMLQPFARYFELYERRSDPTRRHTFSDQDVRDIQVWWSLAWFDHD